MLQKGQKVNEQTSKSSSRQQELLGGAWQKKTNPANVLAEVKYWHKETQRKRETEIGSEGQE